MDGLYLPSQTTIYWIFCMCPTRKSLAASESFTQTWKCCWFRETLVHPVIDTPRIFSCFLHPDPYLDLSQGIKIPFHLYSGADCDKSLWGWDWLIWIFDSLYRMLAAPGVRGACQLWGGVANAGPGVNTETNDEAEQNMSRHSEITRYLYNTQAPPPATWHRWIPARGLLFFKSFLNCKMFFFTVYCLILCSLEKNYRFL